MTSSTQRRVASNTAVQLAGKAVVLVIALVSIAVITRYLGPTEYGRYALALMYMQLFGVLADVGIYTTVVRDISKNPARAEELVGNALTLRILLALGVIVLGGATSLLLPYDHELRVGILIAGVPLLFGMVTTSFGAVLQSQLRMGRAVVGDVVGRACALGLVALVAVMDLGFYAVLARRGGRRAGPARAGLVPHPPPRAAALPRQRAVWRSLLAAGLPLGLALAVNAVYFRADTLIISIYEPYSQVGLYSLAYRILEVTLVVGTVFLSSTFPVISESVDRDEARARRALQTSTDLLVVLGAPLVAGGYVLAPKIVNLAAGSEFDGAVTPLRILLVAGALAWVNGVFGFALIAKERQASALWLNLAGLTFNVGLNFLLVPRYGIHAAAIVTVASEVLILAGSYRLMKRHFGFFPSLGIAVPAFSAAALMGGTLWLLRDAPLAVLLPLGAVLYSGLIYALSPRGRSVLAGLRRSV